MASNTYVNKVVYGNETIIDLTDATIASSSDANKILSGNTAYAADGSKVTGTCTYTVDASSATATASEVLNSKTFAKGNQIITGTMANVGRQTSTINTKAQNVTISQGYHDGSGSVSINSTEQAKIIAGNIKNGVTILGVEGSYTGSELIKATTLSATPYTTAQTILPSSKGDYDYFTQVDIAAISYTETDNASGGKTVTIGTIDPAA